MAFGVGWGAHKYDSRLHLTSPALQLLLNESSRRLEKYFLLTGLKFFLFTNCYCYSHKVEENQMSGACNPI